MMMTRQAAQLADRIGRRYRLTAGRISLGELELPFMRIAEPDRVLDDAVAAESRGAGAGRVPYWAELWDAALALGQFISRTLRGGETVLDLGCGMGLAGAAAAARGGRVMLADLETQALLLARLNTLAWHKHVRVRRVNWQTDRLHQQFDVILGADILYERSQWDYLDVFWREHLAAGGRVILAEPCRSACDGFSQWAGERGWTVASLSEPVNTQVRMIRIFELCE
ncbi:MAG TPA: methyltransferase [Tepidisphaeraceae bacterium]|nr:methyltransferase [Tepidisphaeraceae bacterium]